MASTHTQDSFTPDHLREKLRSQGLHMSRTDSNRTTAEDSPFNSVLGTPADEEAELIFQNLEGGQDSHDSTLGADMGNGGDANGVTMTPKPPNKFDFQPDAAWRRKMSVHAAGRQYAEFSPAEGAEPMSTEDFEALLARRKPDSAKSSPRKVLSKAMSKAKTLAKGLTSKDARIQAARDEANSKSFDAYFASLATARAEALQVDDCSDSLDLATPASVSASASSLENLHQESPTAPIPPQAHVSEDEYHQDADDTLSSRDTFESVLEHLAGGPSIGRNPIQASESNEREDSDDDVSEYHLPQGLISMDRLNVVLREEEMPYSLSSSLSASSSIPVSLAYDADEDSQVGDDDITSLQPSPNPEDETIVTLSRRDTSLSSLARAVDPLRQLILSPKRLLSSSTHYPHPQDSLSAFLDLDDSLDSTLFPCFAPPTFSYTSTSTSLSPLFQIPSLSTLLGIISFLPYTYIIGLLILFSPSTLSKIPHPFSCVPPLSKPIERFAHWQWCAMHHVCIFLATIPIAFICGGVGVGWGVSAVVGGGMWWAWRDFLQGEMDELVMRGGGVGECDGVSVWIAVWGGLGEGSGSDIGVRMDGDGGWSFVREGSSGRGIGDDEEREWEGVVGVVGGGGDE